MNSQNEKLIINGLIVSGFIKKKIRKKNPETTKRKKKEKYVDSHESRNKEREDDSWGTIRQLSTVLGRFIASEKEDENDEPEQGQASD